MDHWFYRRNKLTKDALKLVLTVPSVGLWLAELNRHDALYSVQWRAAADRRVTSQELRYTRLTPWPALEAPTAFPQLVKELERTLEVKFLRHANIGANGIRNLPGWLKRSGQPLHQWLKPCADTVGTHFQGPSMDDAEGA